MFYLKFSEKSSNK